MEFIVVAALENLDQRAQILHRAALLLAPGGRVLQGESANGIDGASDLAKRDVIKTGERPAQASVDD